jgi:phosphoribosylaminoimidazole-succinocarboxamide synthase
MREQLVKFVDIIPIEFIVRNIATGSLTKRLGIEDGTILERPLIEYCLKDDKLGDPIISKEHILTFNWLNKTKLDFVNDNLRRLNDFLLGMFRGVGIKLVDFKVEFGFTHESNKNEIILADEISPDTCRLWDSITEKKLDKDRFRKDLGDLIPAYTEVAKRLGILHEQSNVAAVNVTKLSSVKKKIK